MGPRLVTTLLECWAELAFQQDALALDAATEDLAPSVDPLLARCDEVAAAQRQGRRTSLRSQVVLGDANYRLDAAVNEFAWDLERAAGGQDRPRFRRYFPVPPSVLIRHALADEAVQVRSWVAGIRTEPEPEVQRHAELLEAVARSAEAAVAGRAMAKGALADISLKVVRAFIAEINSFRMGLHGELQKRAATSSRGRDWPAKFFRPAPRRSEDESESADSSGAPPGAVV